jgi:hypothetical protein
MFVEAEPHPASPAGQVKLWGVLARRAGPAKLRALILAGLGVVVILLVLEVISSVR